MVIGNLVIGDLQYLKVIIRGLMNIRKIAISAILSIQDSLMEKNMEPEEFVRSYEHALATQDWNQVEPLIYPEACVTFSNGTVHKGKAEVQRAFEKNFSLIKDEKYSMTNVHWVLKNVQIAVYLFDFSWSGLINRKPAQGAGRGTSVLIKEGDTWQLLVEHLGPKSS